MFYAIEYAYGSHVINNGNRADRVLEFTAKRLRDAWVAAGNPNTTASGYRETISARAAIMSRRNGGATWALARNRLETCSGCLAASSSATLDPSDSPTT